MMRLRRGEGVWWRTPFSGIAVLLIALAGGNSTGDHAGPGSSGSGPSKPSGAGTDNQAVPGGKELVLDLGGGVTMEFVMVRPGSFQMGSDSGDQDEKPVHKVTIAKAFYMGKYTVTQEQWKAAMGSFPSVPKGPKYPVDGVNWDSAKAFVRKLSQKTERKLSLPTEAEWEYACRAGSTTEFSFGGSEAQLGDYAWYNANSGGPPTRWGRRSPMPGDSTTCTATCGNGARTCTTEPMVAPPPMARPGSKVSNRAFASCGAVPGSAVRRSAALPSAAGSPCRGCPTPSAVG